MSERVSEGWRERESEGGREGERERVSEWVSE